MIAAVGQAMDEREIAFSSLSGGLAFFFIFGSFP